MQGRHSAVRMTLDDPTRATLAGWLRRQQTPVGLAKRASLHAKCVVVDRREVFVASANFTEAAYERNIEVGLLIHPSMLAERLVRHFEALLAEGVLKPVWDSQDNRLDRSG